MQRLTARLLLLVLLLTVCAAVAEEPVPTMPPDSETLMLPSGMWLLLEGDVWAFSTQEDALLTPAQQELAAEADIPLEDGVLRTGTLLQTEQLFRLYPGAESYFNQPSLSPSLEMFELTGQWYYGADDVLYYRHADGYAEMTMDEVFAALNGEAATVSSAEKIFYLTIDDTPSRYTMDFLAVLDKLDVKATFFVVGAYVRQNPIFLRAIYEQGHTIANHSYSHDAQLLSDSFSSCLNEFQRTERAVAEALGFELDMPILRVPYGASTIPVSYRSQLQDHGYLWIDWNALNGDTEKGINSDQDALDRAFSTAGRYDGAIVMLVHDGKKRTIRTMEAMVTHFRDQGYTFRVLDTNIEQIPGVRMGLPR